MNDQAAAQRITEDEFRRMCMAHDLTYQYSDDHRAWQAGSEFASALRRAASQLDRKTAVRIYNEIVDSKIVPQFAHEFYWDE